MSQKCKFSPVPRYIRGNPRQNSPLFFKGAKQGGNSDDNDQKISKIIKKLITIFTCGARSQKGETRGILTKEGILTGIPLIADFTSTERASWLSEQLASLRKRSRFSVARRVSWRAQVVIPAYRLRTKL